MKITIEKISKSYTPGKPVLKPLALEIASGELFFLLGPSGCGKSTLLRLIAGFISPDSGRILFNDRDVTAPALWLTNSATAPTEILASEVGGMPIDSDALNQNDGDIHVSILDNSGQSTIAQWSFNGGTGSDPQQ
jgi:ABC-type cobalamin/Fe3+-siderophores transport system ATPase subunit